MVTMASPGGAVGPPSPAVNGFRRLWQDLHDIGRSRDTGGYNRFAWTREDHDLREWFTAQCQQGGGTQDCGNHQFFSITSYEGVQREDAAFSIIICFQG